MSELRYWVSTLHVASLIGRDRTALATQVLAAVDAELGGASEARVRLEQNSGNRRRDPGQAASVTSSMRSPRQAASTGRTANSTSALVDACHR